METYSTILTGLSQLKRLKTDLVYFGQEVATLFFVFSLEYLLCIGHYEIISYHLDIHINSDFPTISQSSGQRFLENTIG